MEHRINKRLEQFRKVDMKKPNIEFVNFDSEKGQELLEEMGEE